MDRLARNLADLLHLVTDLTGKGVKVTFQKESLTFTGEDSPMATMMLSIIQDQADQLRAKVLAGEKKAVLAREFGISRETLYQYLRVG